MWNSPNVPKRRALRRSVQVGCNAVSLDRVRVLGEEVLDLSPRGMLIATDLTDIALHEVVAVRFTLPRSTEVVNAEAEVTRLVRGRRDWDRGAAIGLRFTRLGLRARHEMLVSLAGTPPPIPKRAMRSLATPPPLPVLDESMLEEVIESPYESFGAMAVAAPYIPAPRSFMPARMHRSKTTKS